MRKIVLTSVVLLSLLTSIGCSKHKEKAKVAEPVTTEQTTQDNTKLYKEAGLLTLKSSWNSGNLIRNLAQLMLIFN